MNTYQYKAYRAGDPPTEGEMVAASREEAVKKLREKNYHIIRLEAKKESMFRRFPFRDRKRLSVFCREWASLLEAGISHTKALSLLAEHGTKETKSILLSLVSAITDGTLTARAFRQSGEFPEFLCAMIDIGEMSGTLPAELLRMADFYERERAFRKKFTAALAYPLFVLLFALTIFLLILTVVLPSFSLLFHTLGIPLPAVTEAALSLGNFLKQYGLYLLLFLLVFLLGALIYGRSETGRKKKDRFLLRFRFVKRLLLIRFCTALAALLQSGAPLSEALGEAKQVTENTEAIRRIELAQRALESGTLLHEALETYDFTLPVLTHMIAAGFESGRTPEFLEQAAKMMAEETEEKLNRLKAVIEPALLLLVGALTAAIVFTVMLPVFGAIGKSM